MHSLTADDKAQSGLLVAILTANDRAETGPLAHILISYPMVQINSDVCRKLGGGESSAAGKSKPNTTNLGINMPH